MQPLRRHSAAPAGLAPSSKAPPASRTQLHPQQQQPYAHSDANLIKSACAVLYKVHARATQLVDEAEAYLNGAFGGVLTQTLEARAQSYNGAPFKDDSTAPMSAEPLLQRCLEVQALLQLDGNSTAASPSATMRLASALSVLVACLPADWRALLVERPEKASAVVVGDAAAAAHEALAAAPPRQNAASAADHSGVTAEGAPASSTKRCTSTPAVAGLVACPSDLVQLALLLRRRWVLQRDLELLVVALRDICAVATAARASESSGENLRTPAADDVPPPLLAVAVALAMLQLPRAPAMLEAHEKRMPAGLLPVEGLANAAAIDLYPGAATVLPVWLWRASCATTWQRSEGVKTPPAPCTTAAPATVAMSALASACQITRQLFKWEAHVARYVSTVPAGSSSVLLLHQRRDSAYGGSGSSPASCAAPPLQKSDEGFLSDVHAEMSLEHRACNEVQLLWLTAAAAIVAAGADASRGAMLDMGNGALASAEVGKLCGNVERTLRTIWSTSAVARALLPGVLLLLGCASARRRSDPEAPIWGAQSREVHCWMEAYSLGRQVLGNAHPVVKAAAALLPNSAIAASDEQPPPSPAPASRAAALSNAHHSATTTLSGNNPSLPLHSQLQQQQCVPGGIRTRLPPLPPLSASAPRQASPLSASASLRLAPPPLPPTLSRLLPPFHTLLSCPTRPPQSPPPLSRGEISSQVSGTTAATARAIRRPPAPSFRGTLSFSPIASSTAAAADAAAHRLRLSLPQSCPSTAKVCSGQSLRQCYRLQRPEDALTLRSSVKDALLTAGSEDAAAAAAKAKKKTTRRLKDSKGNPPTSTATLLLSALSSKATEAAGTLTSGVDADGRPRQQWRRDRNFLQGSPASGASSSLSPQRKQQQQQEGEQEPKQDVFCEDAPLNLAATLEGVMTIETDSEQQHCSDGGTASDEKTVGAPASPTTASVVTADQHHGLPFMCSYSSSNTQLKGDGDAPHAPSANDVDTQVEEAEEEEETLPERNARFQREIFSYYIKVNEQRSTAALTLQMAWRAAQARQALRARRQVLYQYVYTIQKAAALAIDGFVACALGQRRRRAALHARAVADEQRRGQEHREVAAAQRLTRALRQWLQRQRERRRLCKELSIAHDTQLRLYEIVAVKVQQWWRRVVVEKAYWRRRTAEVVEQQRLQAEVDRQAHAAANIQKRVRGMQARRRVAQLRADRKAEAIARRRLLDAATTALAIVLQEYVRRQDRLRREALALEESRNEAAQRIAVGWRRTVERRRLELAVERARQLRTSALCIQRAWRRYAAGHQRRYLRQLRHTVQQERLACEALTYEVLRLLQCFSRSAQAQLLVRRLKARRGRTFMENLFLIQATGRGALIRVEVARMRVAEQAKQRAAAEVLEKQRRRAISLLQVLLRERASAALVQRRRRMTLAEKLVVRTTAAREMREDAAAIVLQRAVCRHQRRQRAAVAEAEAAAAAAFLCAMVRRVQQAWRAFAARRERRDRAAAVAQCARKRCEWEEVWYLIWQDQLTEADLLCMLERQYIEEQQHAERVRLYDYLCSANAATEGNWSAQPRRAFDADADVLKWAALYGE
ncbi:hypothetical protein CUR178_07382 [Leishmania enriettii]|uniref:IQ calmodulin-binding motif containing protein n=1 Tax=Leishmania enriettii TaxID=5663 RepID=A0A836HU08_LEIEN|nr:hypothetical protein CUR178_07382 [Leishmania enriettii]